jgi:hypothetical protein
VSTESVKQWNFPAADVVAEVVAVVDTDELPVEV